MSGFIATGTTAAEHKIENDAFWPRLCKNAGIDLAVI